MTSLLCHTFEAAETALIVEIVVSAPGLRVHVRTEDYQRYQADPMAYIAKEYRTTSEHVRRYISSGGFIQCMHVRSNRKQCRNQHGVHAMPGQIELARWLELDASGWYCHRHGE